MNEEKENFIAACFILRSDYARYRASLDDLKVRKTVKGMSTQSHSQIHLIYQCANLVSATLQEGVQPTFFLLYPVEVPVVAEEETFFFLHSKVEEAEEIEKISQHSHASMETTATSFQ